MNLIKNTLTAIYVFCSAACFAQTGKIDSSNVKKLRVDPQTATGLPVSALFQEVKYIPLETNKESIFGEIAKLEVTKDRLVIFDFDTWSVLIFNKEGKYIGKITDNTIRALGTGALSPAGSGKAFGTFIITRTAEGDFIDIPGKNVVFRFNMDGVFKQKIAGPYKNLVYQLSGGTKILDRYTPDKTTYYAFSTINAANTINYFPFSLKRYEQDEYIITGSMLNYEKGAERMLFHNFYAYDLFEIAKAGVALKYQIILPEDIALPKGFLANAAYRMKRYSYFLDNKKKIYGLSGCYEIGDYLYFTLSSFIQQQGVKESLAYNLKTKELISLQDISPDRLSYFLPVNDCTVGNNFFRNDGFSYYDPYGNYLYTSISSDALIKLNKQNTAGKKSYPEKLTNYFKHADNTSNPVVVMLQLKN